jgi:MoxR-like ATPase
MVERLLIGLLTGGHVLFEGVPGARQDAHGADAGGDDRRLLPAHPVHAGPAAADVVGTVIYNARTGEFVPHRGADLRAHRAGRRDQPRAGQGAGGAAGGDAGAAGHHRRRDLPLPDPFLVLATQNPIEQEGTYPLPEAQVDRFMLKVVVGYPTRQEEKEILRRMSGGEPDPVEPVATPEEILAARAADRGVPGRQDRRLHPGPRLRHARAARLRGSPTWRR